VVTESYPVASGEVPAGAIAGMAPELGPLCAPVTEADPCGPDLDADGNADYLSFFAHAEGVLPTSFFSVEDGKPFDPSTIDSDGQLAVLQPLLERSRDIRLLVVKARFHIIKRDLSGFVQAVAAIATLLEQYWETVHPRLADGSADARALALSSFDASTVMLPLQFTTLFEAPRAGPVSYRNWIVATGEAKPREGEPVLSPAVISEAIAQMPSSTLASARHDLMLLSAALNRIRKAFAAQGQSAGLESIAGLAGRMLNFVAPNMVVTPETPPGASAAADLSAERQPDGDVSRIGPTPASMEDAAQALAAIAQYYSRSEPSSPALPLVRQAHQLIGKSFLEVMTILMPSQVDKAAFQIGTDQVFELPVEKLSHVSGVAPPVFASEPISVEDPDNPISVSSAAPAPARFRVETRAQAIGLLESVQRYFRTAEPSSPVPMLCDRARALVERDFMGVLRDVLPKSALKNLNSEK
jgi:type VI secretion system protein ImpA